MGIEKNSRIFKQVTKVFLFAVVFGITFCFVGTPIVRAIFGLDDLIAIAIIFAIGAIVGYYLGSSSESSNNPNEVYVENQEDYILVWDDFVQMWNNEYEMMNAQAYNSAMIYNFTYLDFTRIAGYEVSNFVNETEWSNVTAEMKSLSSLKENSTKQLIAWLHAYNMIDAYILSHFYDTLDVEGSFAVPNKKAAYMLTSGGGIEYAYELGGHTMLLNDYGAQTYGGTDYYIQYKINFGTYMRGAYPECQYFETGDQWYCTFIYVPNGSYIELTNVGNSTMTNYSSKGVYDLQGELVEIGDFTLKPSGDNSPLGLDDTGVYLFGIPYIENGEVIYNPVEGAQGLSTFGKIAESPQPGTGVHGITSDNDYIYTIDGSTVYKILKSNMNIVANSGSITVSAYGIINDALYIYTGGNGKIQKLYKSNLTYIGESSVNYGSTIKDLAQDDTYVYAGGLGITERIMRIQKSDLSGTLLWSSSTNNEIYFITSDSNYVYASASNIVYQFYKSNGTTRLLGGKPIAGTAKGIVSDGAYLYCGSSDGKVYKSPIANMTWVDSTASLQSSPIYLELSGSYLYATMSNNNVTKILPTDMSILSISDQALGGVVYGVAADGLNSYVGASDAGTRNVWKYQIETYTGQTETGLGFTEPNHNQSFVAPMEKSVDSIRIVYDVGSPEYFTLLIDGNSYGSYSGNTSKIGNNYIYEVSYHGTFTELTLKCENGTSAKIGGVLCSNYYGADLNGGMIVDTTLDGQCNVTEGLPARAAIGLNFFSDTIATIYEGMEENAFYLWSLYHSFNWYNTSDIPSDYITLPPDIIFDNLDAVNTLSPDKGLAIYYAWLKQIVEFYDENPEYLGSISDENFTTFDDGIIINCTLVHGGDEIFNLNRVYILPRITDMEVCINTTYELSQQLFIFNIDTLTIYTGYTGDSLFVYNISVDGEDVTCVLLGRQNMQNFTLGKYNFSISFSGEEWEYPELGGYGIVDLLIYGGIACLICGCLSFLYKKTRGLGKFLLAVGIVLIIIAIIYPLLLMIWNFFSGLF